MPTSIKPLVNMLPTFALIGSLILNVIFSSFGVNARISCQVANILETGTATSTPLQ